MDIFPAHGHAHIDESEIWVVQEATSEKVVPSYRPVSTGGKNLWPMWGADGETLFFMSDRTGTENLWRAGLDGGEEQGGQRDPAGDPEADRLVHLLPPGVPRLRPARLAGVLASMKPTRMSRGGAAATSTHSAP